MNLEDVIKENAGLIWQISKKFYNVNKEDLYQAGVLGVVKAYQNYKKDGDVKFSSYAYMYIYGEMYNEAFNKEIKLSKDVIRMIKRIEQERVRYSQELMRHVSNYELAKHLGMDLTEMEMFLGYASEFISMDSDNEEARDLHEVLTKKEYLSEDDKILIDESLGSLESLERDIINARYFEDLTQSETARKLGITQVMVSRYESKSLNKMRDFMYM